MLHSAKPEEGSHLSTLTLDEELQDLEFDILGFSQEFFQYILTMSNLPIWKVMYNLCHCMLEEYNLLFDFHFTGNYS